MKTCEQKSGSADSGQHRQGVYIEFGGTVRLVDFCTCPTDCYPLFPFLCQGYVAVLKQLSFNFKNDVFFPAILEF
jgi:hypothetical protein